MVSRENISLAAELLKKAAALDASDANPRLTRHLFVAAALREVLTREPIVVGGTAEDFYTADEYHETDLGLVTRSLTDRERQVLVELGFEEPKGRHWYHTASKVAVEMPEALLHGDPSRVHDEPMPPGHVLIISPEDLYLDRLRQATSDARNESFEKSALAIAVTQYEGIDWSYVDQVLAHQDEPSTMKRIDSRVRRRARRILADGPTPNSPQRGI